ncbi:TrmB family transcriptional regulator [Candidatus Woesearchaeota archaeon]|nr:TrmB family transcriptional regulator [Candidatus Woesearchaeota archaeon]
MIIQKETVGQLRDIGLNSYESKLWLALLAKGVASAGELSDMANVPRSRSYDVLESLEKKGFIIMKIGKPIKYIAVQPEHVIDNVRQRLVEDAEMQDKLLTKIEQSPLIEELKQVYKSGVKELDPLELTGSIKGRKSLYHQLERMIKGAEKSIILVTTTTGILRKKDALKSAFKKAKEKRVRIKIAANITPEIKAQLEELAGIAELRHTDTPARFCVVDGKEVVLMPMDGELANPSSDVGIWVRSKFFAATFERMFETAWPQMKPVF